MNKFLFEIMHESIPSEIIETSKKRWIDAIKSEFEDHQIRNVSLDIYLTNTRVITSVNDLPSEICKDDEIIKGPKSSIADEILEKFLKKHGKNKSDAYVENGFYYVKNIYASKNIEDMIPEICINIMKKMKWNKVMFWSKKMGWIRPIRRLVSIFNGSPMLWHMDAIDLSTSSSFIYDLIKREEFIASNFEEYENCLENKNIYLEESKKLDILIMEIENSFRKLKSTNENDKNTKLIINNENNNKNDQFLDNNSDNNFENNKKLCCINQKDILRICSQMESVNVYCAEINDTFEIPNEIKQAILKEQQHIGIFHGNILKYLFVFSDYALKSSDLLLSQTKRTVLSKFNDAYFFWTRDMACNEEYYSSKLQSTLFYKDLGSLYQKSERIKKVAERLCPNNDNLIREIGLIQFDLCMQTVDEMTELQGLLSYFYAKRNNENENVCNILYNQYVNNISTKDDLYLSLLYNLDSALAFIGKGMTPSGSADPLAIRRKCLQIIDCIIKLSEKGISVNLNELIENFKLNFDNQGISLDLSGFSTYFQKRCDYVLNKKYGILSKMNKEKDIIDAKKKLDKLSSFAELDKIVEVYNRLNKLDYDNAIHSQNSDETENQYKVLMALIGEENDLNNLLNISYEVEKIFDKVFLEDNLHIKGMLCKIKEKFEQFADFK
ncbi:glycine--tRNA ligase subunit beta [Candidatus Cytomitobacter indipagum]|uniref:glycine--tRNA ligase n=1 Tax=Candidatus Cytomitobacter indipagum TaxID=2601575 RepID=A0A5C0UE56_9PROT|nr:glycine--tRNA ligase subunit beta [Candidatus Cytomitobacter indipagum]QEK37990.1 glycine--tRNA ligase subunit beta [Candidatus Cytomitobacter indipagum]